MNRVVVADPAWAFKDKLGKRGAEANYKCMPWEDIANLELPPVADDALLFLWRVGAMQSEALAVMHMWGFTPTSELVWVKRNKQVVMDEEDWDLKDLSFGMGHYVRNCHEVCLIGRKGKNIIKNHSVRSVFTAPLGAHSEKPDKFFRIVESLADGPYVELFARKHRDGWTCLGNELGTELRVAGK